VTPRLAVVPELESELDDLFGRPLSEFTPARNELARRLKNAGQDEAAARIQALKKPSVPVWAVNQLARRHPDEVQELISAGERLRKAQQDAFRGGGSESVREATGAERAAARTLTRRAHDLLEAEGRPSTRAVTDRIGSLLRAAAIDPDAAALLSTGRLTDEVESTGFGAVAGIAPAPSKRAKARPKDDAAQERREEEQRRKRLEAQVQKLRRAAAEAEKRLERAEQAAEKARAAAEDAREALQAAEAELNE
jgi:DNA repair exonuclease SbcCD ATPase subunit